VPVLVTVALFVMILDSRRAVPASEGERIIIIIAVALVSIGRVRCVAFVIVVADRSP
jgi:hypothetical protein